MYTNQGPNFTQHSKDNHQSSYSYVNANDTAIETKWKYGEESVMFFLLQPRKTEKLNKE